MLQSFKTKDDSREPLLLSRVTKRYGRGSSVFPELSFRAESGSATGLVGPNGSGKTTLLRLLSVVSYPSSGRIEYRGMNIHDNPYKYLKYVGVVQDTGDLPQYLNAVELLAWILRSRNRFESSAPDRIAQLLDRLGLDERRENVIGTYSSGMLKKTQIAAALVFKPSVLLLDEPFRGLDDTGTISTLHFLSAFIEEGGILIVSSHVKSTLEAICSQYIEF